MDKDDVFRKILLKYIDIYAHGDKARAAERVKLSPSVLGKYMSDNPAQHRQPSYEEGLRILIALGVSDKDINKWREYKLGENLLGFETIKISPPEIKKTLPVYEYPIPAGPEASFENNRTEEDLSWYSDCDFILKIKGSSMLPLIPDGAFAGIKKQSKIDMDKPMFVRYRDEQGNYYHAIKFIKVLKDQCELSSTGGGYKSIMPSSEIEIIGAVIDIYMSI